MTYDHDRFTQIIEQVLTQAWRDPEELEVGENISDFVEIKVMFNKHGTNEDTGEDDDKSVEEYCVFVHRDSGTKFAEFPEHQKSPLGIIHRPKEEMCLRAWFIKSQDRTPQEIEDGENEGYWDIEDPENSDTELDLDDVMDVLEAFAKNHSIT